ncbi:ribonulease R [Symbiobacterium thermophilum IAM 14863]|uniref:Ribonuclease R n=2 Tax=Symbiobacterium thermophilum TaxID=2734 RepID=Q67SL9_SYMTH|nr:ribonuclease R [Symbiobacterium thermophilum]BAD39324.1 ribonulease R [Symbiobacterium thermophilum IAM 14863]
MRERIAEFIREQAYKPMGFAELAEALGIPEKQHARLRKVLEEMERAGEVVRTRTERYGAPERMNLVVGRLQGHPRGFAFVIPDHPGFEDVFIGREALGGAWHNDRVIARIHVPSRADGRPEGEVIRILERANARVVGTFETSKHLAYVVPDDKRLPEDIYIPKGMTNGARSGEKVVVQIVRWPDARRGAEGRVVERLGMKGDVGVDIVSIIRKHGLPEAFPAAVLQEAEQVPEAVTEEALNEPGRRDLRDWTIVTIDGEDAKDLDDAVSVVRLAPDRWQLGVHIADVAAYVPEGSALDREAYRRGTSVYLADRVVPMLPPRLSNGICSLNPGVDRLTLSCVMEIDGRGEVRSYAIFPSVIRTAARLTYTRVNAILNDEPGAAAGLEHLVPMCREMAELMAVLRERRMRRGALDFDLPEAKVKLNEQGWPTDVLRVDRGIAERIIEEFMLVANETVAEHCSTRELPVLYRVHEPPASDKVAGLSEFLQLFGYNLRMPRDGSVAPKDLQKVTLWAKDRPEENLIGSVLLRTMKQARYSEERLGHFGLAAEYYCHFTSPIRRYPDLVVHRVLRAHLQHPKALPAKLRSRWERKMPDAAQHCSERERAAAEAERETIELKKAEYMSERIGERFEGIISGVTPWGFYVQLPNTVEGLVHVSTLTDDYYHFHPEHYALMGERTRRRFRLGDRVMVRVSRVDVDNRQVDFLLDEESDVQTVVAVPRKGRQRAARKAAAAGRSGGSGRSKAGARKGRGKAKGRDRASGIAAHSGGSVTEPVRGADAAPLHAPGRESIRYDMWGLPIPAGRGREREVSDPTVNNPFSVTKSRSGGRADGRFSR